MKKLILSLLAVTVLTTSGIAEAQNKAPQPHRVGLIDMAHVFQNYKKFEQLRTGLQAEIEKSDAEAKQKVEVMQKLQEDLKRYESGRPEYEQAEKAVLNAKGDFEAFRAATQRQLARRESEMFKVIYGDVTKMVEMYAKHAELDVVMRFNRKGIDDSTSPADAVQTMNKTIIYYRQDKHIDITDFVLNQLNVMFEKNSPTSRAPIQGAGLSRQTQ